MTDAPSYPLTLIGKLAVDVGGTVASGCITIETGRGKKGTILSLSTDGPPAAPTGDVHYLSDSQLIYPGLLNLHNHTAWDFIPLWHGASSPVFNYDNRFQWQAKDSTGYIENVLALEYFINDTVTLPGPYPPDLQLSAFSEIQAVCGGTTVLQEGTAPYGTTPNKDHILIRGTGNADDMEIAPRCIDSAVKFYEPAAAVSSAHPVDTSSWAVAGTSNLTAWENDLETQVYSGLVHLSEGRFGFLNPTKDAYTRNEFLAFKRLVTANYDPGWFQARRFNMIHACGIDLGDQSDIDFLTSYGISVLWSPVSNCMLYSDTIPITELIGAGINCVLTSDWSPSGSKHVWDEAKHAEIFMVNHLGIAQPQARQTLYQMMTQNAATAIGRESMIGTIQNQGWADLFILDNTAPIAAGQNAIDILFDADDSHTVGVYTGGMLVLAEPQRFNPPGFSADFQQLPATDGPNAAAKWINFNANGDFPLLNAATIAAEIDQSFKTGGTATVNGQPINIPPGKYTRSKFLVSDDHNYQTYMQQLDTWLNT